MNRLKNFSVANPTGTAPGVETLRIDVLQAAVDNSPAPTIPAAPAAPLAAAVVVPLSTTVPPPAAMPAPAPVRQPEPVMVSTTFRIRADLKEFIDYTYTKDQKMQKQEAYNLALEAFFRPLMR